MQSTVNSASHHLILPTHIYPSSSSSSSLSATTPSLPNGNVNKLTQELSSVQSHVQSTVNSTNQAKLFSSPYFLVLKSEIETSGGNQPKGVAQELPGKSASWSTSSGSSKSMSSLPVSTQKSICTTIAPNETSEEHIRKKFRFSKDTSSRKKYLATAGDSSNPGQAVDPPAHVETNLVDQVAPGKWTTGMAVVKTTCIKHFSRKKLHL